MTRIRAWALVFLAGLFASPCFAAVETPYLAEKVASGKLPRSISAYHLSRVW